MLSGYVSQTYQFDFFNYAGIHRPVILYTTPQAFVDDITLKTDVVFAANSTTGILSYEVAFGGDLVVEVAVEVLDANDTVVVSGESTIDDDLCMRVVSSLLVFPLISPLRAERL